MRARALFLLLALPCLFLAACPDPDPQPDESEPPETETSTPGTIAVQGPIVHQLVVTYVKGSPTEDVDITDDQAASIFADMTKVLASDDDGDGELDLACNVEIQISGSVKTAVVTEHDGYIYCPEDYRRIIDLEGCVKVVKGIFYCGGEYREESNSFWGCGEISGTRFAVLRNDVSSLEGKLWAHEFGHNRGLDHRDPSYAVMHEIITGFSEMITEQESKEYVGTPILGGQCEKRESNANQASPDGCSHGPGAAAGGGGG